MEITKEIKKEIKYTTVTEKSVMHYNLFSHLVHRQPTGKDSTDDHGTQTTKNGHQVRMPSVSLSADETQVFAFVSMLMCPLTSTQLLYKNNKNVVTLCQDLCSLILMCSSF
jgi:hypothetical protein